MGNKGWIYTVTGVIVTLIDVADAWASWLRLKKDRSAENVIRLIVAAATVVHDVRALA